MGIAYRCDKTNGVTLAVWSGQITPADWEASISKQVADPEWPAGPRYLTDIRSAVLDPSKMEPNFGRMVDKVADWIPPGMKYAIVAPNNFQLASGFRDRMKHLDVTCIVFTDFTVACLWLGLDRQSTEQSLQQLKEQAREVSQT